MTVALGAITRNAGSAVAFTTLLENGTSTGKSLVTMSSSNDASGILGGRAVINAANNRNLAARDRDDRNHEGAEARDTLAETHERWAAECREMLRCSPPTPLPCASPSSRDRSTLSTPVMLKYVRLYSPANGETFFFTLPPVSHADLATAHAATHGKAVSAGFVHFGPACGITTHGRSTSLNIGPLPDDALRISLLYAIVGKDQRAEGPHTVQYGDHLRATEHAQRTNTPGDDAINS